MKHKYFFWVIFLLVLLAGCDSGPVRSSHRPVLPVLPDDWNDILGEPYWRLEWIGKEGKWRKWEGPPGSKVPELLLIQEWTTPVFAWPFWPECGLTPGLMRPAGALFPWDAAGQDLVISWEGGVAATFWKELAAADRSAGEPSGRSSGGRFPWQFDWPRFRELLKSGNIPEAAVEDLWLVDWKELGKKTVQSGFDRRRITSMNSSKVNIPDMEGRWISSSPFAASLETPENGLLCLEVTDNAGTWVSAGAVIKCSASGWVLRKR